MGRAFLGYTLLTLSAPVFNDVPGQIRNAHNLLQDMAEEADLYAKAGDLVKLLNSWRAASVKKLPDLIVELAQLMADTGFWEQVTCLF